MEKGLKEAEFSKCIFFTPSRNNHATKQIHTHHYIKTNLMISITTIYRERERVVRRFDHF